MLFHRLKWILNKLNYTKKGITHLVSHFVGNFQCHHNETRLCEGSVTEVIRISQKQTIFRTRETKAIKVIELINNMMTKMITKNTMQKDFSTSIYLTL